MRGSHDYKKGERCFLEILDVTRFSTFSLNLRSLPGPNYSLLLLTQKNKPYEDSYLLWLPSLQPYENSYLLWLPSLQYKQPSEQGTFIWHKWKRSGWLWWSSFFWSYMFQSFSYLIIRSMMSWAWGSPLIFCSPNIWQEMTYENFISASASSSADNVWWIFLLFFPCSVAIGAWYISAYVLQNELVGTVSKEIEIKLKKYKKLLPELYMC